MYTAPKSQLHDPSSPLNVSYPRRTVWIVAFMFAAIMLLWLAGTPLGVLDKFDAVGYAICHQIAERSFHTHDGHTLPLCARCTGIYLGVIVGLALFAARGRLRGARLPGFRVLAVMMLFGATYAFDGLNSYLSIFEAYNGPYQPHNTLRLFTGLSFGLGLITFVLPVFNGVVWYAPPNVAPVASLRELALLYLAAAGTGGLVLLSTEVAALDALLIVLGALSTVGVMLMFTIIGAVLLLTITRRENTLAVWRDLRIPALAGLAFAFAVIGVIDLARYVLTGTWAGFALPG